MSVVGKIWRSSRRLLLVLAVLAAIFFFVVMPGFFTHIITRGQFHFPDPDDGKTPISYGLDFRWIEFTSSDGVRIKGWYVPAPGEARGTILYGHGHNRTRIEMLSEAAFAHGLGYNGLLFDFRHQGQSGGDITTIGYHERLDVLGAARHALAQEKAARPVIAWGISMGAAAALMAAADSPDLDAVIADSTFLSFRDVIEHHLKLFLRLPTFPIADEIIYLSAWRGNFRPEDFDLRTAVERIGARPILFVAVEGDRRMPPSIARDLYGRAQSPLKQINILPGSRHGAGYRLATEPYQKAVTEFLARLTHPAKREEEHHVHGSPGP